MIRALFVDDEQNILDSLQDLLHKNRKTMHAVFALGGEVGLKHVTEETFDVVVSDMQMPGMDGAAFLKRVRDLSPCTMRIILSGQADQNSIIRALPVAHQFLNKPCDEGILYAAILRASQLSQVLASKVFHELVGGVGNLPSLPATYIRLSEATRDPKSGVADYAKIIQDDPAVALKMLQVVNSGYFALKRPMASIAQAVSYLGIDFIKSLVLGNHVFVECAAKAPGFSVELLQKHSLITARVAKALIRTTSESEDAFTAGLLHDVGKLILAAGVPKPYTEACRASAQKNVPLHVVEKETFGVNHAELGAYLLSSWGLPISVVEAVAFHHDTERVLDASQVLAAVHIANVMDNRFVASEEASEAKDQTPTPDKTVVGDTVLNMSFIEKSGIKTGLKEWQNLATVARRSPP